jgi:hypothetical protein
MKRHIHITICCNFHLPKSRMLLKVIQKSDEFAVAGRQMAKLIEVSVATDHTSVVIP